MRVCLIVALVFALLVIPGFADGKGATAATITGDGIAAPIQVEGSDGRGNYPVGDLADKTAFFDSILSQTPTHVVQTQPTQSLGPKLVIDWTMPTGEATTTIIRQDVYPYADGGPVVFTAPDQPLWAGDKSTGGWFRAPLSLTTTLHGLGVPDRATLERSVVATRPRPPEPATPVEHRSRWVTPVVVGAAALFGAALLGAAGFTRRRTRIATA
jgi:hypothetical protein